MKAKFKSSLAGALNLPVDITAMLEVIQEQTALARDHARHERVYWLKIGEAWLAIKDSPALDNIGIKSLEPHLPHSVQFLNRCAVAFDGHATGDLDLAERWVEQTGYRPRNAQEPYLMAELVEAYRARLKPRPQGGNPRAHGMIEATPFVHSDRVSFGMGGAMLGDAHTLMAEVPDGIVDAVIVDPPYAVAGLPNPASLAKTSHAWDVPMDWDFLWPHIWRVLKPAGTVAICSMQPLSAELIHAQARAGFYLYSEYWFRKATNILGPFNRRPLNVVEEIPIFCRAGKNERTYNPQMTNLERSISRLLPALSTFFKSLRQGRNSIPNRHVAHARHPANVIIANRTQYDRDPIHCQKPVDLMRYLIRTYTNPGELVLDFCAGSFTTPIACLLEGRKFLAMEQYRPHFALGSQRLKKLIAEGVMQEAAD
jgi:DNA modification methylase